MMRVKSIILTTMLLLPTSASADVVYSYAGNSFTTVNAPYTAADSVTGYFVVATAIPGPANVAITPLAFSFSDGINTLTNLNTASHPFWIMTGPSGEITAWDIIIESLAHDASIFTEHVPSFGDSPPYTLDRGSTLAGWANDVNSPGIWTVTSVPELSTWTMLLVGFISLASFSLTRNSSNA